MHQVIIIGSGPAGHTSAIYTARAGMKPIIMEGHEPGGQLTTTTEVDNFPGFPNGIQGPELMIDMKKQAERFDAKYVTTTVTDVDLSKSPFKVTCENNDEYLANTVIISTGASAKYLGLDNEKELIGKGVSACATCDGFFYKEKTVLVVGGGDTAMEEATFLTKFAKEVYVIHRRDQLRASKAMQDRATDNPKIKFLLNSEVTEILFNDSGVTGAVIKNNKENSSNSINADGIFMGIGHTPNTSFLNGQIKLDNNGFIVTDNTTTNIPGVFACGDVQDSIFRQAITAAGSGCMAAIKAEHFISE
ncbi:MAG: thioredoxin-disulfide reductase [Bdellovibrionales bacterium]|nr:thioredoxin-disulfide reductase [Bdellovibrionales bacterium]